MWSLKSQPTITYSNKHTISNNITTYLYGENRRLVNLVQVLANPFKSHATDMPMPCGVI